ncbi:hypothetical protein LEP1GSC125_3284 [Leptospira mayottensis 200901122]|uniref:Uncharacterized protein n=1 Tax=Leptospira mayottensis 200901122 TaxID=1193010 RepID=A0AA87MNK4_9LEPT|nr:hypothetical protein LEP1GSC125_3284 [Leptospira mayottensis 200901122]
MAATKTICGSLSLQSVRNSMEFLYSLVFVAILFELKLFWSLKKRKNYLK